MNRTITLSPVEPAALSLRWPQGLDLGLDLLVNDAAGNPVDMSLVMPVLQLEPRSGGAAQSYQGQTYLSGAGGAAFAVPGDSLKDANGYRLSLFGALDGVSQLLARGMAAIIAGPAIPASLATGRTEAQRGTYNLSIVRNDSWTWQFVLWGDAAKTIPSDLTGATVAAQVRNTIGGAIVMVLPTEVKNAAGGIVWMSISSAQSGVLPSTPAYWDMQITYPDGDIKTPVGGRVVVTEDITR